MNDLKLAFLDGVLVRSIEGVLEWNCFASADIFKRKLAFAEMLMTNQKYSPEFKDEAVR